MFLQRTLATLWQDLNLTHVKVSEQTQPQFPVQYLKQNVSCPVPCQAVKFFCCLFLSFWVIPKDIKIAVTNVVKFILIVFNHNVKLCFVVLMGYKSKLHART